MSVEIITEQGDIRGFAPEIQRIRRTMLTIRRGTPESTVSWEQPADLLVKREPFRGELANVLNVTLTPTGCDWAKAGGCTMCGEWSGSTLGNKVDANYHIAQFTTAIAGVIPELKTPWVRIYQEGSFTNPHEVDPLAQRTILRSASLIKGIEKITIETMARYITNDSARSIREAVGDDVELELGIGFEAQDEVIRAVCVNKGESINQFKTALRILKANGIKTLAYVLVKPPFLGEQESIDEATKTAKKALELGFDAVSLEPVSIQEWSLVEALHANGLYKTPWLWSLIEVLKNVGYVPDLRVGGSEYYPRPTIVAHNRHDNDDEGNCNYRVWKAIEAYNLTHEPSLLTELECACREAWKDEQAQLLPPLKSRVNDALDGISIDDYLKAKVAKKNAAAQISK
jgi:hypothetical protein